MFIPDECVGFHHKWVLCGDENEEFETLDTIDVIKAVISIHYDCFVKTGVDNDGLMVLDKILMKSFRHCINDKIRKQREFQLQYAKQLIKKNKLSLIDAVCMLFTKDEICAVE